jgi:short-subunit dehydrogenase
MSYAKRFSCALVTGASAGLGEEFVLQLAPRVDTFVLVARREDRLNELAAKVVARFPKVTVEVIAADLVTPEGCTAVVETLSVRGLSPDLLINNAGMGDYGEFVSAEWSRVESQLRLNMEALTHLCHALLPGMIRQRAGAIINISSLASLLPIPDFAVYAATKAYVTSFSEALRIELKGHGIPVLAVCPGPVHTEFGTVAFRGEIKENSVFREAAYVDKSQVVSESIAALDAKKARVYPSLKMAVAAAVITALPICAIRLIMGFRPRK